MAMYNDTAYVPFNIINSLDCDTAVVVTSQYCNMISDSFNPKMPAQTILWVETVTIYRQWMIH